MLKENRKIGFLIFFLIILIIILVIAYSGENRSFSPENVQDYVYNYGIFAPIIFIILYFFQVIFPVIPGQVFQVASGYLFGNALGIIYCYIAVLSSSVFIFFLSRKFGRKFVKLFIPKETLDKLSKFIKKKEMLALIVMRLIPFLPGDAVNFVSGISKVSYKKFIIGTAIGIAPSVLIFTIFGSELALGNINIKLLVLIIVIFLLGLVYFFRKRINKFLIKNKLFIKN